MNDDAVEKLVRSTQEHLGDIRRSMGLTGEEFGKLLGLSRASVSKLENGKSAMTISQCIAVRYLLDAYAEANPRNRVARMVCESMDLEVGHEWTNVIFSRVPCFL